VAADMDSDGHPDLAVVDFSSDQVAFLEGNGRGRFAVPILAPVGHGPSAIAHGSFGGKAGNDLAIANRLSDDVTILYGDRRDPKGGVRPPHDSSSLSQASASSVSAKMRISICG